jgi:hypothetical protein
MVELTLSNNSSRNGVLYFINISDYAMIELLTVIELLIADATSKVPFHVRSLYSRALFFI